MQIGSECRRSALQPLIATGKAGQNPGGMARVDPAFTPFTPEAIMLVTRALLPVLVMSGLLAACAELRADPPASPRLDSGVTSSFGGGTQVLGGNPNVGVTTRAR